MEKWQPEQNQNLWTDLFNIYMMGLKKSHNMADKIWEEGFWCILMSKKHRMNVREITIKQVKSYLAFYLASQPAN